MSDEETKSATEEVEPAPNIPSLFRNYTSFTGAAIAFASLACIVLLFLIEITGATDNPYLSIFTWILLPTVLIFGLFVIFAGMWWERRRRRRAPDSGTLEYPMLDLNDPRRRRALFVFMGLSFIFVFMSAFGSYRAYEYSESVAFCGIACHVPMKPEYIAFQVAPHASLHCVDCHVGAGAGGYVGSKFSGIRRLYGQLTNNYSRPIASPVHDMPSTNETCAKCHWPQKFFGVQLKEFNRFAYDEHNTLRRTRLLVNTGGGSPTTGAVSGIHWHMNLANEVTYISTDKQRQVIPWVRIKDSAGTVTEYMATGAQLTPEQIAASPKRVMECIDCHNRPTHIYVSPDEAVNKSLVSGKLDPTLPFLKREAVAILSRPYSSTEEALNSISTNLPEFYRVNYSDVYAQKGEAIRGAVAEVRRLFTSYSFPEMKTDWKTHPNNIGHYYSQGCFRCHDGQHVSQTGKVIRNDCAICHTALDQFDAGVTTAAKDGAYVHPVELGDLPIMNCAKCHKGDGLFQHPRNLGDITQFRCTDCHSGKIWSKARV